MSGDKAFKNFAAVAKNRRGQGIGSQILRKMRVFVNLFGVDMELLGFDCSLTFEEYHDFYRDNYNEWAAEHVKRMKERI